MNLPSSTESNVNALWTIISLFLAKSAISLCDSLHLHHLISLRKITLELSTIRRGTGFAPIFPDICYHLTHYKPAAADIPVASDNPAHYADAIRYNAR
ncbi:hypothetical protein, partial [Escherichia coli]|uniref:hypothetical protein n=1 Tax=Escherichia coli TaxID=562 RepID=UPI001BAEC77F